MSASATPKRIYLIDGSGYIFRAYHALPPMTRKDGTPTNTVVGFCNMLWKLEEEALADGDGIHLAVIFDAGRHTFRNAIYADYKAHRPEAPDDLVPQFPLVREAVRAFGVPCVELDGFEADDVIATYVRQAREAGDEVVIVSSDKDLMQLVGNGVSMLDPIKNRPIGEAEVVEKFGVPPDKVVEVQALAGDATDNVPGVPGIGVKTAAELIKTYGDLETLLAHAPEIKQPKRRESLIAHAEAARVSRQLVKLRDDVPLAEKLDDFAFRQPDPGTLLDFLERIESARLALRVKERLAGSGTLLQQRPARAPALAERPAARPASAPDVPEGYALVRTVEALRPWIERALDQGAVAVAAMPMWPDAPNADLVGLALATDPGRACYIPLAHRAAAGQGSLDLAGASDAAPDVLSRDAALGALKPLFEDPGVLKIGHNAKHAIALLNEHGVGLSPIGDSMLISYVLEGGAHAHDADALAELHQFGLQRPKYAEVAGTGKARVAFDQAPLDKARDYAAGEADAALRLHRLLRPRLVQEKLVTVYETIERPLVPVIAAMELAGVTVDAGELRRLSQDLAERLGELETQIYALAGRSFNIGSPKQLGEVLFDEMGLDGGGRKGKTGAYSTGAEVLSELAAQGHDLPARILDWRQLAKLKSTYTDALLEQINKKTGRVHTSFELAVTSTGRLSSTDPNLQNIPIRTEEGRKIRRAFVAEAGMKLLSVDYSQIELRLAAHMADIAPLKEAFQKGADIHAITAAQVFGIPVEGMDPMIRRRAKAINFGIIYGISPFGLAQQLGIPQAEAKAYIEAYFVRYPGIRDYMERIKKAARAAGYVTTLFGRRCHVPGINDKNPARRSFMERAAINAPLQGTAADIIKRAMIRVPPALAAAGLRGRMLLQVHDELLFEVPAAETAETAALVKQVMERAPLPAVELSVPLVAEAGVGDNWAEAH